MPVNTQQQSYNLYQALRNRIRSKATGQRVSSQAPAAPASPTTGTVGTPDFGGVSESLADSFTSVSPTGDFAGPYMGNEFSQAPKAGFFGSSGPIVSGTPSGYTPVSAGEAAIAGATSAGMFNTDTKLGKAANYLMSKVDPTSGAFGVPVPASIFGGPKGMTANVPIPGMGLLNFANYKTTVDPYGKTTAIPSGLYGKIAEMNIQAQYDIADQIAKGTPGYAQAYIGGNLVGLTPGPFGIGYTVTGTFNGTAQDFVNAYSAMNGVDPKSLDANNPVDLSMGTPLSGFVTSVGGLDAKGNFVSANGVTNNAPMSANEAFAHIGLVNDIMGLDKAMDALSVMNVADDVAGEMLDALTAGELHAQAITDSKGNIAGYTTAMGGFVTDSQGNAVTTGTGGYATYGQGPLSPQAYNAMTGTPGISPDDSMFGGFSSGTDMSAGTVSEWNAFDTAAFEDIGVSGISSGEDGASADDGGWSSMATSFDNASFDSISASNPGGDGGGDAGSSAASAADSSGPFAYGGRTGMADGGTPPVLQEGQTPAGFAEKNSTPAPTIVGDGAPATEAETVADNIPVDVPEGTFVLNAPAVEFMGLEDAKKMLLGAMQEAERQGIDIVQNNTKMSRESLTSLVVSKKEILVPPVLAEIIGYDRLEKINNRGKREVEKRIAENGQDIPPEAQQAAAGGGEQGFAQPKRTKDELYNDPRTAEELEAFNQVIAKNKDKNFVQRMLDANSKGMPVEGEPGKEKTHRMNAEYFPETNEWVAFPSVIQKSSGEMYDYGDDVIAAGDHARNTGEYISFGKDADAAIRFSIHYKESDAWGKGRGSKKKMAYGGDSGTSEAAKIYESIKRQGGDPRLDFEDFTKTMKAFQKGKVYRPMREEPDTPEFDAEVKQKYNLFFPDEQKYPYMDEAEREAAREMDKANMIDMSLPIAREREDGSVYYVDRRTGKEVPNPDSGGGFISTP